MIEIHNIFQVEKIQKQKKVDKPKILVDYREKNSLVISELEKLGCQTSLQELKIGDYITKRVVIERKTIQDFLGSMINKRLRKQLKNMQQLKNKLLIIEGTDDFELYNSANKITSQDYLPNQETEIPPRKKSTIHENAIRGFLLSISLNYKIPIIFSKNSEDTAKFIMLIAKKKTTEQGINDKPKPQNKKEQLQFIVEGFPGIGPKTAKKLLQEFKTIKKIINASEEDLKKVIGKKAEVFELSKDNY